MRFESQEYTFSDEVIYFSQVFPISAMLPDGTFSWKWFKSLAQRSDLNLVGSTWSPK